MTARVILNPYSNRWNSQKRWPDAEAALKSAGVQFDLVVSQHKGQIVELAEQAAREGCSPIIVAGGDGTLGDALNGLARAAASEHEKLGPVGIMPTGSANDLAYALALPTDLSEAARVIARGKTRAMDVGKLNDRYFINNSGGALEPYVSTKHEKIHWIKGMARYLVAAVQAIMDKPEWQGTVQWDGGSYTGKFSLISVGNGRRTGGFFMTPHADPFDGKLTFAYGYRSTRAGMFQALPKALNEGKGNYTELEGIHEVQATRISLHLDAPSPAHTDGELLPQWIKDFEYTIQPARINMIIP
jgi:diacylglycerol kinase (ATP)